MFDAAAPHIRPDQTVIISGHLSFGALYLARKLAERGITVADRCLGNDGDDWAAARPTQVRIANIRKRSTLLRFREARKDGLAVCQELFGDRFVPRPISSLSRSRTLTRKTTWGSRSST